MPKIKEFFITKIIILIFFGLFQYSCSGKKAIIYKRKILYLSNRRIRQYDLYTKKKKNVYPKNNDEIQVVCFDYNKKTKKIIFFEQEYGNDKICEMDLNGSNKRIIFRVNEFRNEVSSIKYIDINKFLYIHDCKDKPNQFCLSIYNMTTQKRKLIKKRIDYRHQILQISLDGKKILLTKWTNGKTIITLNHFGLNEKNIIINGVYASWHPYDSNLITYYGNDSNWKKFSLYTYNLKTKHRETLYKSRLTFFSTCPPVWTRNSEYIIFVKGKFFTIYEEEEMCIIDIKSKKITRLIDGSFSNIVEL